MRFTFGIDSKVDRVMQTPFDLILTGGTGGEEGRPVSRVERPAVRMPKSPT
jgi:hypothetical protein